MAALETKSLRKAVVPSTLIPNPSPGSLQSTRLALHVDEDGASCCFYIASGCNVYKLQVPIEDSLVNKGKDSLLIPDEMQVLESFVLNRCPHRSEIQSIVLAGVENNGNLALGSVDAYGHLIVSRLHPSGKDMCVDEIQRFYKFSYIQVTAEQFMCNIPTDNAQISTGGEGGVILAADIGVGEGSWAGLCFSPKQWSMVAVARSFCKSIDLYDQDIHLQTLNTLWYPYALNFIKDLGKGNESSLLAVAEGCQLTVWDLRMKENGGCLQRICGSPGDIFYAISSSSTGNIAVGGADRTVTVYDPRRWSALSRWVNCSKYEITGLAFSSINSDYIYIQGVDYEVFCGQWRESKRVFSFRGDSNWLGFSKCSNRDLLGGWCDSGSIFMADVVETRI